MSRIPDFLRRQRRKDVFADFSLNPNTPLPSAATVQALGQARVAMALPLDASQQYPLMNADGKFVFIWGFDDPNNPNLVI